MPSSFCPGLNVSQCDVTENSDTIVTIVYNPLPVTTSYTIKMPVKDQTYLTFCAGIIEKKL